MSSWKQYGGKNKTELCGRINTEYLSVNKLILKESYPGDLFITGGLNIDKTLSINRDAYICGNAYILGSANVSGNMVIGNELLGNTSGQTLTIWSQTIFKRPLQQEGDVEYTGNLDSLQNSNIAGNLYLKGSAIFFGPTQSQTLINKPTGMGINTLTPSAGLHLETENSTALKIRSSAPSAESILVENSTGSTVKTFANTTSSGITMFNANTNIVDVNISTAHGTRTLLIDSSNVNVLNKMTISTNSSMFNTVRYEPLTVFGIPNATPFYPSIYSNTSVYNNPALAIKSINHAAIASLRIDTSNNTLSLYGGRYAGDGTRTMGMIQLDDKNPTIAMVSGSSTKKYFSTTGINTYKPMTDDYVLNVNGPVNINNNDISTLLNTDFEICDMSESRRERNFLVAIGNKWDLSGNKYIYKNMFLYSSDYGTTWSFRDITTDISSVNVNIKITGVSAYDRDNIFITGQNNTLLFGNTTLFNFVSGINIFGTYNNIFINPFQKNNDTLRGYFSIDLSNSIVVFDMSKNNTNSKSYREIVLNGAITNNKITYINSIQAYSETIYIGGVDDLVNSTIVNDAYEPYDMSSSKAVVIKYNHSINSNISVTPPVFSSRHVFNTQSFKYTINDIQVFDNSFVVGVGNSCVLFTKDGGQTWKEDDKAWNTEIPLPTPVELDISLNSCYIIDYSNVIMVGTNASSYQVDKRSNNIFINGEKFFDDNNPGKYFVKMPEYCIESSGKRELLISNTAFRKVLVQDINNVVILNTSSRFIDVSNNPGSINSGSSILYNIFTPNYRNERNNTVLDIYGTVSVTSNINLGGDVVVGNMISADNMAITSGRGSTSITSGALVVSGGVGVSGTINALAVNNVSDYRIKSGVTSLHDISYNVDELNPVYYFNEKTKKPDMGFIAHELQTIYPFLVSGVKDGESLQSIHYSGLFAVLVKEVQELKAENQKIKQRLSQFEL